MSDSIFTKIKNKEIPGTIVYKDDQCFALEDINPQAPIHILIVPHKEIAKISDTSPAKVLFSPINSATKEFTGFSYNSSGLESC